MLNRIFLTSVIFVIFCSLSFSQTFEDLENRIKDLQKSLELLQDNQKSQQDKIQAQNAEIIGLKDRLEKVEDKNLSLEKELATIEKVETFADTIIIGKVQVSWGKNNNLKDKYTKFDFPKEFDSSPIVIVSVDGAFQNDASCNTANISPKSFEAVAVSRQGYPARPISWLAVGIAKK